MKIQKYLNILTAVLLVVGLVACGGGGKYADAKKALQENNTAMEKFVDDVEKAEDGTQVAAALTTFTLAMQGAKAQFEKLEEKYPEFKGLDNPPAELKPEADKLETLTKKMSTAMMKVTQFMNDPAVKRAQEEFLKVMR